MVKDGLPVTALPCMHVFHETCLAEWREVCNISNMSKCPLQCHRSAALQSQHPSSIGGIFARQQLRGNHTMDDEETEPWEFVDSPEDDGEHQGEAEHGGQDEEASDDDVFVR